MSEKKSTQLCDRILGGIIKMSPRHTSWSAKQSPADRALHPHRHRVVLSLQQNQAKDNDYCMHME
jgi:hypothetical protein